VSKAPSALAGACKTSNNTSAIAGQQRVLKRGDRPPVGE
jgi:hypothetical protein